MYAELRSSTCLIHLNPVVSKNPASKCGGTVRNKGVRCLADDERTRRKDEDLAKTSGNAGRSNMASCMTGIHVVL